MNTTFNINRLGLLLKRYFIENKQREIMFWSIMILVYALLYRTSSAQTIILVTGFIFAAREFKVFAYAPGGMHYLLIPATHTEKLTSAILLNTFYFFGMSIITYTLGHWAGTTIFQQFFGNFVQNTDFLPTNFNNPASEHFWIFFGVFALIQAIFMLGSLYFKRSSVGRTMLSVIALGFILGLIELLLIKILFGTYHIGNEMVSINISANNETFSPGFGIAGKIVGYLLIPFFWIVSYFRLTEKQV